MQAESLSFKRFIGKMSLRKLRCLFSDNLCRSLFGALAGALQDLEAFTTTIFALLGEVQDLAARDQWGGLTCHDPHTLYIPDELRFTHSISSYGLRRYNLRHMKAVDQHSDSALAYLSTTLTFFNLFYAHLLLFALALPAG